MAACSPPLVPWASVAPLPWATQRLCPQGAQIMEHRTESGLCWWGASGGKTPFYCQPLPPAGLDGYKEKAGVQRPLQCLRAAFPGLGRQPGGGLSPNSDPGSGGVVIPWGSPTCCRMGCPWEEEISVPPPARLWILTLHCLLQII